MALELDITPKVEGSGGSGTLDIGTIPGTSNYIIQDSSQTYYNIENIPNLSNKKMISLTADDDFYLIALLIRNETTNKLELISHTASTSVSFLEDSVIRIGQSWGDATYYAI